MNTFLLFCILIANVLTIVGVIAIQRQLDRMNDFSKEDVSVKAMTEQTEEATERVVEAKNRLPRKEN